MKNKLILIATLVALVAACKKSPEAIAPEPFKNLRPDTIDHGPLPDAGIWYATHFLYTANDAPVTGAGDNYKNYRYRFHGNRIFAEDTLTGSRDTATWHRIVADSNRKHYIIQFNGRDSLLTIFNRNWRIMYQELNHFALRDTLIQFTLYTMHEN